MSNCFFIHLPIYCVSGPALHACDALKIIQFHFLWKSFFFGPNAVRECSKMEKKQRCANWHFNFQKKSSRLKVDQGSSDIVNRMNGKVCAIKISSLFNHHFASVCTEGRKSNAEISVFFPHF